MLLVWPSPGGLPAKFVLLLDGELPSAKAGGCCDNPCCCFLPLEAVMDVSVLLTVLLMLLR